MASGHGVAKKDSAERVRDEIEPLMRVPGCEPRGDAGSKHRDRSGGRRIADVEDLVAVRSKATLHWSHGEGGAAEAVQQDGEPR